MGGGGGGVLLADDSISVGPSPFPSTYHKKLREKNVKKVSNVSPFSSYVPSHLTKWPSLLLFLFSSCFAFLYLIHPDYAIQKKKLHHSSHIRLIRWTQPVSTCVKGHREHN